MNIERIEKACRDIEENTSAVGWLESYGRRELGSVSIEAIIVYASGVSGAKEAKSKISAFAERAIPNLIEQAICDCRGKIEAAEQAIIEEAALHIGSTHPEGAEQ